VVIPSSPSTDALRVALDVPEGTLIGSHTRLLDERTRTHPHTVKLMSNPQGGTCVAYAFELNHNPIYEAIREDFGRKIFAGRQFVEWMIRERLSEISQPAVSSLVLYFSGSDWKHIGTVTAPDRVTSQWGTYPIYEHDVYEVPASYGDQVRFFEKPSPERALSDFLDYARYEGVSDEDIDAIIAVIGG
jgi:hypothetical protein